MVQDTIVLARRGLAGTGDAVAAATARVAAFDPRAVVAFFVAAQWALVAGLALVVRHNGWVYYQGGDQLWYYTGAWLFGHGSYTEPLVGYLWSIVLTPIALLGGPNLVDSFPAIVLLNVVVLLPIALLCLYGIARRIAGRLFAYWVLVLWIVVPLLGIRFTNTGYHQRFTEILLPQGFGLTAMADFPTMVAVIVSAYFCLRALCDVPHRTVDALAAGVAAGAALATKPSAVLFLAGPAIALLGWRHWRTAAAFSAGLAPAVLALALWKWRGYGYVPVFNGADAGLRMAAGASVAALNLPGGPFNWQHFTRELDLLREHFWSARLIEWFVIAGAIGIMRKTQAAGALVVGWFLAPALVKAGFSETSIEDTNLLRILIPAYPAFVLLLASLPFLLPRLPGRIAADRVDSPRDRRLATGGLVAAVALTAVIPAGLFVAASPVQDSTVASVQQPPLPANVDFGLRAEARDGGVRLSWDEQGGAGGRVFYRVYRNDPGSDAFLCNRTIPAGRCALQAQDLGATRGTTFVDRAPVAGATYRIGVAANWLDDPDFGDVYVLSRPLSP